jgi:acetyltransferase-like isoleucine patch superfamily enzyme
LGRPPFVSAAPLRYPARLFRALQYWLGGPKQSLRARYPDYQIGAGSYGDLTVLEWGEGTTLTIGAYSSIGSNVTAFLGGEHRTDWVTTFPFSALWEAGKHIKGHPASKGNVAIGSDVWIANDVFIMSGVTIGDGAVIGARAVVTKDVPAYAVVAGNPSRIVRFRFDPRTINRLLAIRWWEWEPARIANSLPVLLNADIESFLAAAESGKLNSNSGARSP